MARGRFISSAICRDKTVCSLSDPWSILGFTWLIAHADVEGRTPGDPAVVKSMVFPRFPEITVEKMESYIKEWAEKELILWYSSDDDLWISFPNFQKHQIGLRKNREASSQIPAPPLPVGNPAPRGNPEDKGDLLAGDGILGTGETPEQLRSKSRLIKVKLIKENNKYDSGVIPALLAETANIVAIPPRNYDRIEQILDLLNAYGRDAVAAAFKDAFNTWVTTPRKDGGGTYDPLNFSWIDRAQVSLMVNSGQIPKPELDPAQMTPEQLKTYLLKESSLSNDNISSNSSPP